MALFPADPKKKTTKKVNPATLAPAKNVVDDGRHHTILRAPWLSEKALIATDNGVYVFEVPTEATKYQIAAAIESIYKVTPRQIRVANLPAKKKALRDRRGF